MPRESTTRLGKAVPFLWLALSMIWAAAIFVTDQPAWPLAIWIATTVGPLTVLRSRQTTANRSATNRQGETL